MSKQHKYELTVRWTGNNGTGTSSYRQYERSHTISITNKTPISASSDPAFRGDSTCHNPEEFLVASLASCHMLSYLHLCAEAGVIVMEYTDTATGTMEETPDGGGRFNEVTLHPLITVLNNSMLDKALELHHKANHVCFIANSVNFPVLHQPVCTSLEAQ